MQLINSIVILSALVFFSIFSISAQLTPYTQVSPTPQPISSAQPTPLAQPALTLQSTPDIPDLSSIQIDELEKYSLPYIWNPAQ